LADDATSPYFGDEPTAFDDRTPALTLDRGTRLASGRYEVLEILGEGGMGAVYKARDHEVDRFVAIKVIQPGLASSHTMLRRFKQELLLARQVTHKNVVRIFDIGESDGMKFITMEYVDGGDLRSLIVEKGKFGAQEAVNIIRQICDALDAAHTANVVHRDLKPQNIMVDTAGRVVVMDFGIAHSKDLPGMTMTGALIGTPDYMSPEQAKGAKTDARSDIFSLGLIFYEMLTGKLPFEAATMGEKMLKRINERAVPPADINHDVPVQANKIVVKCLEPDLTQRYQSVKELLEDLETIDPAKKVGSMQRLGTRLKRRRFGSKAVLAVAALLILGLSIALLRRQPAPPPAPSGPPRAMQVLISDFSASDPELNGTVEPLLGLALEGASFINNYDRGRARTSAARLKPGAQGLNEELARLVAASVGVDVVISGSISKRGDGYRITATAVEGNTGKERANAVSDAENKSAIPGALSRLAASLRTALGDTVSDDVKLAQSETISTSSIEALKSYAQAQELRSSSKWEEAIRYYTYAIQIDPNLGRAYSGIAAAAYNLGRSDEADKNYKLALSHIERMTDREKYRTRGAYYLFKRNTDKAIEELKNLVDKFPADTAAQGNLALALFFKRDFTGALVQGQQFVKMYPTNTAALENVGLYALYAGDWGTADREATRALELNANLVKSYFTRAIAALAQNRLDDATGFYEKLKGMGTAGASLAASGLADIALFEGRYGDATKLLDAGVSADLAANERSQAADKLATLALIYADEKDMKRAVESADRALALDKDETVAVRAAQSYVAAGQPRKADPLIKELQSSLSTDPPAYAKLIEGEIQLQDNKPQEALDKFKEAQKIANTWLGHFDLGRAYLASGAFPEALSEFDECITRRGEATALFLDERPTYHLVPQVFYYQARVREGLKSVTAVDQYRAFLQIKEKADKDPLVEDAKKRVR